MSSNGEGGGRSPVGARDLERELEVEYDKLLGLALALGLDELLYA